MTSLLRRLIRSERGQALPIVLALLVLGGLVIVPSLDYATVNLKSSLSIDNNINGVYAADAGVEEALWSLGNDLTPPTQLPETINQMDVSIETEDKGNYTVYFGELIEAEGHCYWLDVTGAIEPVGGNTYEYTITVTWQADPGSPSIKLKSLGARLPPGYEYQDDSAGDFPDNLSTDEPDESQDEDEAWMVNWALGTPAPEVSESDPVATQVFYITGEGDLEGDYAWVVARSSDISEVGEMTGGLHIITSTATRDSETTAKIVADVLVMDGTPYIVSWQISK